MAKEFAFTLVFYISDLQVCHTKSFKSKIHNIIFHTLPIKMDIIADSGHNVSVCAYS